MVTWVWNTELSEGLTSINCWGNLGILGKIGLSILATKCCHLVLWGQDLLHIQRVCRLNKVDENLPYRTPYKCIFFRSHGSTIAKVVKEFLFSSRSVSLTAAQAVRRTRKFILRIPFDDSTFCLAACPFKAPPHGTHVDQNSVTPPTGHRYAPN